MTEAEDRDMDDFLTDAKAWAKVWTLAVVGWCALRLDQFLDSQDPRRAQRRQRIHDAVDHAFQLARQKDRGHHDGPRSYHGRQPTELGFYRVKRADPPTSHWSIYQLTHCPDDGKPEWWEFGPDSWAISVQEMYFHVGYDATYVKLDVPGDDWPPCGERNCLWCKPRLPFRPTPDDILDDPRMNGQTWNDAFDVTADMLDAWPVWEGRHRHPGELRTVVHPRRIGAHSDWRPLRLPGMGPDGIVQGEDMTDEHWARCHWQVRHVYRSGGVGPWQGAEHDPYFGQIGYQFRPVCWQDTKGGSES